MKHLKYLFPSFILIACTTGTNYPQKHAQTICSALFECVDEDAIDLFLSYDNIEECEASEEQIIRNSGDFDAYEEGDAEFNKEAAEQCLNEILEVRADSDCNGNMNIVNWGIDIASSSCDKVYE